MIDLKNLQDLISTETKLGETHFRFNKMPAIKGWRMFLEIREAVGQEMNLEEENPDIMRILMTIPTPKVLQFQNDLFNYVEFWNDKTTPQQLKGAEDMAFEDMESDAIMEILIRSLCVNFSSSSRGIIGQIFRKAKPKADTRPKSPKGSTRTSQRR